MKLRGKSYFRDKTIRRFQEIKWLWGRTYCTIISSSLQPFWHQGQVSWKTISAWSGDGVGRMVFGWAWDFFGRNDAKAETPVLWPPHAKSWLIGKDSDAGRDWEQEEKGTTEDEMAGWHHWPDGRESQWTPGVGDGQGGLECCDSWGRKESDTTERLIWSDLIWVHYMYYALYFYYYYINFTSDHQALDPRVWGPLMHTTHMNSIHLWIFFWIRSSIKKLCILIYEKKSTKRY